MSTLRERDLHALRRKKERATFNHKQRRENDIAVLSRYLESKLLHTEQRRLKGDLYQFYYHFYYQIEIVKI